MGGGVVESPPHTGENNLADPAKKQAVRHFKRPRERAFTKSERGNVTLLLGGLTLRHDTLLRAAAQSLGYNVELVPVPEKQDFQAGKEYGNNGQCNPTYFTVGALVNYLKRLRDHDGMGTEDILKNYVFLTAGACGPCRFGMYEAEYRLALRNSGFDEFRVILFQQKGGMEQSGEGAGLDLNINFALALLNGLLVGDSLNEVAYHVRPYETVAGQTNKVFDRIVEKLTVHMAKRNWDDLAGNIGTRTVSRFFSSLASPNDVNRLIVQLTSDYYGPLLRECRDIIDREIEVDYTRPKPICKITGEFWAQTTEGDGNFNMFTFLESQGAEVLVEPIATWVNYMLAQAQSKCVDRRALGLEGKPWSRFKANMNSRKQQLVFDVATKLFTREVHQVQKALGGTCHQQINQLQLQRMGHPFYNRKSGGGEGHLEVAKSIYYTNKSLAHMVMSLKPFGCMPSTQSDGAQAVVMSKFPDMLYIPIETSGEGDVNAHSRAQMALGEAKLKSKREFKECVDRTGYTIEAIRAYVQDHAELRRPLQHIPHQDGIVGRAANFILKVGHVMDKDRAVPTREARRIPAAADTTSGR
jgi:predicted nucleotide-binding protein (sugar kinase/HSP70/actin superfamily)